MSNNIDEMSEQFKELADKQFHIEAQHNTIIELSKKINALETERDHLKLLLEQSTPLLDTSNLEGELMGSSNEEMICRAQIAKLNILSSQRDLTLEECRKLEIYAKILNTLQNRPKTIKFEAKKLGDGELLKLLDNGESSSG